MLIYFKAGTVTSGNRGHGGRPGVRGGSTKSSKHMVGKKISIKANSKIAALLDDAMRTHPLSPDVGYSVGSIAEEVRRIRALDAIKNGGRDIGIATPEVDITKAQGFDREMLTDKDTQDFDVYGIKMNGDYTKNINGEDVVLYVGIVKDAKKIGYFDLYSQYDARVKQLHDEVSLIEQSHLGNPENSDLSNLTSKEWKEKKAELLAIAGDVNSYAIMQGYDIITNQDGSPRKVLNQTALVEISREKQDAIKLSNVNSDPSMPTKEKLYSPRINALVDEVKAKIQERDNVLIKYNEARVEIADIVKRSNRFMTPDERAAITSEYNEVRAKLTELENKQKTSMREVYDILAVDNPAIGETIIDPKFSKKDRTNYPLLLNDIRGIVNNDLLDKPAFVNVVKTSGRAKAWGSNIGVGISDDSAVAHEFGHTIERNSSLISRRANNYLKSRTSGEGLTSMADVGMPGEYTRRDKFMSPYMGKTYSSGMTEIISMGIEYIGSDPVGFINADEDYFRFMVWALQEK